MTGRLFNCKIDRILIPCPDCMLGGRSKICFPHLLFYLANSDMPLSGVRFRCIPGLFLNGIFNELLYNGLAPALVLMKPSWETMHSFLPSPSEQALTSEMIMRAAFS